MDFRLYANASVVTMNPGMPRADAFLVCGDKFAAVGPLEEIKALAPNAPSVDLEGRTVVPGFIETHGHLSYYSLALAMIDASSVNNKSIEDVKKLIKAEAEAKAPGEWINGWGFDDTAMEENRHLTRRDLDEVAPDHYVFILHASGHLGYANSKALELGGIGPDTANPPGGTVQKDDGGVPTGVLMEHSAMDLVTNHRPRPGEEVFFELIPRAAAVHHKAGVTSVHDAAMGIIGEGPQAMRAYLKLEAEGRLNLRVYQTMMESFYQPFLNQGLLRGYGSSGLKMGCVKNFQDGSIQGLTACLREGYHNRPDHRSQLIMPQEKLDEFALRYHGQGMQMAIHANGDAAVESVITALERAQAACPREDARHMIIHCQMAGEDHIARMKALGAIPSFFPSHVYFWGDRHLNVFLGEERASRMNPLGWAVKAGLPFTIHNDTPVTPVSPIHSIHNAVNRITRNGVKLGADQCITPYQALEAYTTHAALCSFEEDVKGAVKPGLLADFTVLSDDPLAVDPLTIKDIAVLETYVGGRRVYNARD